MGKVRVLLLSVLLICAFFSSESNANSAACILLKQQMSAYQHSKTHPTYRRAQRDYERLCNQPEEVEVTAKESVKTQQSSLSEEEKRLAQERFEALEASQQKIKPVDVAKSDASEQPTSEPQKEVTELAAEPEHVSQKTEPKPALVKPINKAPVTWQNDIPVEESSLLEAMMLPIILLIVVLIAIFVYVKFVRSRMDEIKEKAQEMSKDIAAMGSKVAEKKKNKLPKGALDPELYFRRQRVEVTLASGKEVVLDSVIASQYGVFVVLSQKQRGAIIGSATLPEWKEQAGDELIGFESPLQVVNQCCHAVAQILGLNDEVEPIVAFNDMAVFKSQFPIVVMHKKHVNSYILGFKELKYSDQQVDDWIALIDSHNEARREEKKRAEERQREENLNRHNDSPSTFTAPTARVEQEIESKEQETVYPEPGSYESSVTDIEPDNQDAHREEVPDKPAVDHIAELDAILNKAKQFTEKLDDISGVTPKDNTYSETPSTHDLESANNTFAHSTIPPSSEQRDLDSQNNSLDDLPTLQTQSEDAAKPALSDEPLDFPSNSVTSDQTSTIEFENNNTIGNDESGQSSTLPDDLSRPELHSTAGDTVLPPDSIEPATVYTDPDYFKSGDESAPENMVPHSEFKRRAAKRAVDDGMFDYLNYYDKSGQDETQTDSGCSLEEELAQSLAAGKGFLSGLEHNDEHSDIKNEEPINREEQIVQQSETILAQDVSEADVNSNATDSSTDLTHLDNSFEKTSDDGDQAPQGGWRAIKAQMDEQVDDVGGVSDQDEPQQMPSKSSWRALKEQVNEEINDPEQEQASENKSSEKPSPFANLQLDPDWAPKPPPEKVFKTKPEDDPDNN